MSRFSEWRDYLREGVADLAGVRDEMTQLREASFSANALARRFEDVNWWDLVRGYNVEEYQVTEVERRRIIERAWRYYFDHPVIRRTVDQLVAYTFGNGVTMPTYIDDQDDDPTEEEAGNDAITRFWKDEENQLALTGVQQQIGRGVEGHVAANIFLRLYPAIGVEGEVLRTINTDGGQRRPSVKLSDVAEHEIRDIIKHPDNALIPLYYKRVWVPVIFDPAVGVEGAYVQDPRYTAEPRVEYIPDWKFGHLDPMEHNGAPWGPRAKGLRIGDGFIYHVAFNRVGRMKFGISQVQSTMKWAQGIDQYMTARMNTVLALARLAMRAKVKGGVKSVSQVASAVTDMTKLAQAIEGGGGPGASSSRRPYDLQGATRAAVENQAADLVPAVQDTNSGGAVGDLNMMLSMVAAGSGVPGGYLGLVGQAGAELTTLDGSMLKLIQQDQLRWSQVFKDLCGFVVRLEGLDPERVQHTMPPILERDAAALAAWLIGVLDGMDPNKANRDMMRWMLLEIMEALGKPNAKEIVDRILPVDAPTPMQQTLDAEAIAAQQAEEDAATAAAQAERESGGPRPVGSLGDANRGPGRPRSAATTTRQAAHNQSVETNQLRFRGTARPGGGGAFSAESRERRQDRAARRTRNRESRLVESGVLPPTFEADATRELALAMEEAIYASDHEG